MFARASAIEVMPTLILRLAVLLGSGALSATTGCRLAAIDIEGRPCPCPSNYLCDEGRCASSATPPVDLGVPCPTGMVAGVSGPGPMGNSGSEGYPTNADEAPIHTVTLSPFCIDLTEVITQDYETCVGAGQCTANLGTAGCNYYLLTFGGTPLAPINCITWTQAEAYCAWTGSGTAHPEGARRLPTEAEWERAARLTDRRRNPWGAAIDTSAPCTYANLSNCVLSGDANTADVGSLPKGDSPSGVEDLIGNVSEWVSDYYSASYYADACAGANGCTNPSGPATGTTRVYRGGSVFSDTTTSAYGGRRYNAPADTANTGIGVRCAFTPP